MTALARNPHEAVARARKVAKLLQFIRSCGTGEKTADYARQADYLASLPQADRDVMATAAGCNTPSETTWAALVKAVRETPVAGPSAAVYRLVPHAAHYQGAGDRRGHDLEEWDICQPRMPTFDEKTAAGIPPIAEFHSGYLDKDRRQHWIYTRIAPLSPGTCSRCGAKDDAGLGL